MTLDRALGGTPFAIDKFRCLEAAQMLASYRSEPEVFPWSGESFTAQFIFKTLFISICHQMNWDVLQNSLASWMLPGTDERLAEFAQTTPAQISSLLDSYPKKDRIRAQERARTLRETAHTLQLLVGKNGALQSIFENPVLEGSNGFYDVMSSIPAYSRDPINGDPMEKKVRVLAHDLYREKILHFADPENLKPAVEYHLIRLYLRTGRVYPTNPDVAEELRGVRHPARRRLVMLLRETVDQAMRETAFYSGLDVATLNYVEWQLARTICSSELKREWHPYCEDAPVEELPDDIRYLVTRECPYSQNCRAFQDRGYDWFHEPQFEKSIY